MSESLQYGLTFVGCLAGIAAFLYFIYVVDESQNDKEHDDDADRDQ
jgi:hypothetical protein